ncbi:MAG: LysR family transcriptional regulator substrate-binding protein, partial [Lachnospiraceae bacterium]
AALAAVPVVPAVVAALAAVAAVPAVAVALVAVLPQNYYSGDAPDAFPIREILEQPFILSASGIDYDIHTTLENANINPESIFSSTDDTTIVSMVANQLGISILPKLTLQDLNYPVLTLPLDPYASRELGIAYRSRSSLSPASSHFISSIQKTLAGMLAE